MTFVLIARRWILRLAITAAVAAAVLVYAILHHGFPTGGTALLAVIGIVAATAPPLVLAALWTALGELLRLPERLQNLPLETRRHGEQLRELYDRARTARGSRFRLARVFWDVTRTTASTRETLTPYAPLLPLVSVPFLTAAGVAAIAAAVEILAACVVAVVLATA